MPHLGGDDAIFDHQTAGAVVVSPRDDIEGLSRELSYRLAHHVGVHLEGLRAAVVAEDPLVREVVVHDGLGQRRRAAARQTHGVEEAREVGDRHLRVLPLREDPLLAEVEVVQEGDRLAFEVVDDVIALTKPLAGGGAGLVREDDLPGHHLVSELPHQEHVEVRLEGELLEVLRGEELLRHRLHQGVELGLHDVPEDELLNEIIAGRSISLCFPRHRIFSSAIVGGILPIATGLGISIKRKNSQSRVHCFLGDMTAETGIAHECMKYSRNLNLPIRFIIEDNGKSVCTDTLAAWGMTSSSFSNTDDSNVVYYRYDTDYPHAGAGVRVQF